MPGPAWIFPWIAGALALIGLALFAWAIVGDLSRGRRRCPNCWHDMAQVQGRVCPECGHDARFEARLHRAHRHYKSATLALLLLVAAWVAFVTPTVRRSGWISVAPASALIFTPTSLSARLAGGINAELMQRARAGELAPWQIQRLAERVADQLIATRATWPANVPLAFHSGQVWGSGRFGSALFQPKPRGDALPPRSGWPNPDLSHEQVWTDNLWSFPPKTAGEQTITVDVTLLARDAAPPAQGSGGSGLAKPLDRELWRGTIRRTVLVSGDVNSLLSPVRSMAADDAVKRALAPRLVKLPTSGTLCLSLTRPDDRALEALTLPLRIEFVRDDEVVASASRFYPAVGLGGLLNPPLLIEGDAKAVEEADPKDPRWLVRIKADPELALRDFPSSAYWDGLIELPLADLTK